MKTMKEKLDQAKSISPKEKITLNPILKNRAFAWIILGVSIAIMFIKNFLSMYYLVGAWDIISYLLLLTPLAYLAWKKELSNEYIKWFFPLLLLMIWDMFYYSNELVQHFVPLFFYLLVVTLYFNSMHKVHSFYQTLLLRSELPWRGLSYIKDFLGNLFIRKGDKKLYARIFFAILITIPFLIVFVSLLLSADENFKGFLTKMFDFKLGFEMRYFFTVPLYFILYLLLFIYGSSNHKDRTDTTETKSLDMLIVGIFLGMINLLFALFIMVQIPFLLGEPNLPAYTTLAEFAREGFFQLMMVMGIVLLIFLFIMRRFKGEKVALFMLGGLLIETIIMGLVSLKKMHLYQSIKGATVMRYYVEWFDYFLLIVLVVGVVFLVRKLEFRKLLNVVAVLGMFAFGLVISLNVDGMVASHNIEKFKNKPNELDSGAISRLSIDALPMIQGTDILINTYYKTMRNCNKFSNYHLGYCLNLSKYGTKQYKDRIYEEYNPYSNPKPLHSDNMSAEKIYESCAGCHGKNGEVEALGKSAIITGKDVNTTIQQLKSYRAGVLNLYGMGGLMKGQVHSLSDEQISSLAIYISKMKQGENNESK